MSRKDYGMMWSMAILWGLMTTIGVAVLFGSKTLSLNYNAWTTSVRERNPHMRPPPTPQMRELNTRIMTRLFRFLGAFIALLASLMLIGALDLH